MAQFLQKDLLAFLVVGPVSSIFLTVVLLLLPLRSKTQRLLADLLRLAFSFCAWEVRDATPDAAPAPPHAPRITPTHPLVLRSCSWLCG